MFCLIQSRKENSRLWNWHKTPPIWGDQCKGGSSSESTELMEEELSVPAFPVLWNRKENKIHPWLSPDISGDLQWPLHVLAQALQIFGAVFMAVGRSAEALQALLEQRGQGEPGMWSIQQSWGTHSKEPLGALGTCSSSLIPSGTSLCFPHTTWSPLPLSLPAIHVGLEWHNPRGWFGTGRQSWGDFELGHQGGVHTQRWPLL